MTEIPMAAPKPQGSGTQPLSAGDSVHTTGQRQSSGKPQNKRKNTRRRAAQKGNATAQASQIQPRRNRRRKGNAQRSVNHSYATSSNLPVSDETSAGGLVLSGISEALKPNNKVDLGKIYAALIGRLDRRGRLLWSMPKGHIEPNESYATTAEREVWEETGITGKVFAPLGTIDYWFVSDGMRIHKNVHHHLLAYVDGILNDEDPEVTEVAWIPVNHLLEYLSYADERKLARKAINQLPGLVREHAREATPR